MDRDVAALEEKIRKLNAAYRVFQTKTNAIAKEQRRLLTHLQELLDRGKQKKLEEALH